MRARGKRLSMLVYRITRPPPDYITDRKWDNLIILDACRFDTFLKYNDIPGTLSKINSAGSHTREWIEKTFCRCPNLKNIVYVSSNAWISYYKLEEILGHNPFRKIAEVWKDGWDEELGTVHPSTVNEATRINLKLYPGKKFIIHFIQPHFPFIGNVRIKATKLVLSSDQVIRKEGVVWDMVREGKISINKVIKAYESNLELVLTYVEDLLPYLKGKTCITSDHGNLFGEHGFYARLFGERGFYEHPTGFHVPELIEVPYLEVNASE